MKQHFVEVSGKARNTSVQRLGALLVLALVCVEEARPEPDASARTARSSTGTPPSGQDARTGRGTVGIDQPGVTEYPARTFGLLEVLPLNDAREGPAARGGRNTVGLDVPGSIDYPQRPLGMLDRLVLGDAWEGPIVNSGFADPNHIYVVAGDRDGYSTPSRLIRIQRQSMTRDGQADFPEGAPRCAMREGRYAYFCTSEKKILKFDLVEMRQVDELTPEGTGTRQMVDAVAVDGYGYFLVNGSGEGSHRVLKVHLESLEVVSSLDYAESENNASGLLSFGDSLYFGTRVYETNMPTRGRIVRIGLGSFQRTGQLELDADQLLETSVLWGDRAYFVANDALIEIQLANLGAGRVLELAGLDRNTRAAVVEGTASLWTGDGHLLEVDLETLDVETDLAVPIEGTGWDLFGDEDALYLGVGRSSEEPSGRGYPGSVLELLPNPLRAGRSVQFLTLEGSVLSAATLGDYGYFATWRPSAKLIRMDLRTFQRVAVADGEQGNGYSSLFTRDGLLYGLASDPNSLAMVKVDPETLEVVGRIPLGRPANDGRTMVSGNKAYVLLDEIPVQLIEVDLATEQVGRQLELPLDFAKAGAIVGNFAVIGGEDGRILRVDLGSLEVDDEISTNDTYDLQAALAVGENVYLAGGYSIYRVRVADFRLNGTLELDLIESGYPQLYAVTRLGDFLYFAGSALVKLDLASFTTTTIEEGSEEIRAITSSEDSLYLGLRSREGEPGGILHFGPNATSRAGILTATRIQLAEPGVPAAVRFYAHRAGGRLRVGLFRGERNGEYGSSRSLWASPLLSVTAAGRWVDVRIPEDQRLELGLLSPGAYDLVYWTDSLEPIFGHVPGDPPNHWTVPMLGDFLAGVNETSRSYTIGPPGSGREAAWTTDRWAMQLEYETLGQFQVDGPGPGWGLLVLASLAVGFRRKALRKAGAGLLGLALLAGPASAQPDWIRMRWNSGIDGFFIGAGGMRVAELGGDARPEILATGGGYSGDQRLWGLYQFEGGFYKRIWSSPLYPEPVESLRAANVDQDPESEVVVAVGESIRLYDGFPPREVHKLEPGEGPIQSLQVRDLDSDGDVEVIFSNGEDVLAYQLPEGRLQMRLPLVGGREIAVGNVDGDPALELVITGLDGSSGGYVIDTRTRQVQWFYKPGFGQTIRLADLDADGKDEIICGPIDRAIHVFDADLQEERPWQIPVDITFDALEIFDVTGDGRPEIVVGAVYEGGIQAFDGQTGQALWTVPNPERGVDGLVVADVDVDGELELLWGSGLSLGHTHLEVVGLADRKREWKNLAYLYFSSGLGFGDVDADGRPELIHAPIRSEFSGSPFGPLLFFLHDAETGALEWQSQLGPPGTESIGSGMYHLDVLNLDADPQAEILMAEQVTGPARLRCYDRVENRFQWTAQAIDSSAFQSTEVADLDGNESLEVVAAGDSLYLFDAQTGTQIWKSQPFQDSRASSMLRIANLDADPDLEILFAKEAGPLRIYETLQLTLRTTIAVPGGVKALDARDLDGDGIAEVFVGTTAGELRRIDLQTGLSTVVRGPFEHAIVGLRLHDMDGDGHADFIFGVGEELRVEDGLGIYPPWSSGPIGRDFNSSDSVIVANILGDERPEIFLTFGEYGVGLFDVVGSPVFLQIPAAGALGHGLVAVFVMLQARRRLRGCRGAPAYPEAAHAGR